MDALEAARRTQARCRESGHRDSSRPRPRLAAVPGRHPTSGGAPARPRAGHCAPSRSASRRRRMPGRLRPDPLNVRPSRPPSEAIMMLRQPRALRARRHETKRCPAHRSVGQIRRCACGAASAVSSSRSRLSNRKSN
jgi:hypothetical protein